MKVVILCGGKGARSYPFSEYYPKPLMPVNGRPILVHLMEIYAVQGFTEFVLAGGHRIEVLEDYFRDRVGKLNVEIVDTGVDSDTGERVRRCRDHVGDSFHVTYGDGLGNVDLQALVAYHQKHGGLATLTSVPLRSQYGTVATNGDGMVVAFDEKPVIADRWINAGFMVMSKEIFDHWTGQNLECDVLPRIASMKKLFAYRHRGFWKSVDTAKEQADLERLHRCGEAGWMEINGNGAMEGR